MLPNIRAVPNQGRIERLSKWLKVHPAYGISLMDHLYNRLDGMYEGKFAASFKNETAIQNWREEWAVAFEAEGITPHKIEPTLAQCRHMFAWPPSIKEFIDAFKASIPPAAHRDFAPAPMLTHKAERGPDSGFAQFKEFRKQLWGEYKPKPGPEEEDFGGKAWETVDAARKPESPK